MDILTEISLSDLSALAKQDKKKFNQLISKLQKVKKQEIDEFVHNLHAELFADTDCLQCGNCCKSLGPLLNDHDIRRLSKHLRMKPSVFTETYLRVDEDGDYVYKSMPCPFLMDDNYCMVYDARPKACREYPHTDKVNFQQILKLSLKNTKTCPIVYKIFQELAEKYG
jgi:Fe-S-cluster containining protein